jgi:hypothetical protein
MAWAVYAVLLICVFAVPWALQASGDPAEEVAVTETLLHGRAP